MELSGHCGYYAQRGEQNWCLLKKALIKDEDYQEHCSFAAKARCPLIQDLTLSELARKNEAAIRLTPEGLGGWVEHCPCGE